MVLLSKGEIMLVTCCERGVWLRVVKWDQLPHLLDHMPTGKTDFDHKRITWEEYRLILTGTSVKEAAKVAMERLCHA